MVGKARTFSDAAREAVYQKEFDDELYSAAAQQNSYNLGSVHFSDNSGIANITQAGSDQRKANLKGALFTGNIGFDLQTVLLDVSTDTINLLEDASGNALSVVSTDRFVTLSSGSTADLITILGAQRPGHRLTLYNTLSNTITIKHTPSATQNTIRTPNALDFVFLGNMAITLLFDITTTQWRIVGSVSGSGTTGYDTIEDEGTPITQRTTMNFIGVGVTAVDNPGTSTTDITISTSGYATIQEEGSSLTQRTVMNFIGGDVTAVDNPAQNRTDITIGTGGASSLNDLSDVTITPPTINDLLVSDGEGFWVNRQGVFSGITGLGVQSQTLEMNQNSFNDVSFINSDGATIPGSGFIRMEASDELRWKNVLLSDDLFINASRPTIDSITQDAFTFTIASAVQLYIGQFDISVQDNDIINTGDIKVGTGSHDIGNSTDSFTDIFANYFRPNLAAATTKDGYTKVGTNRQLISYDSGTADSGFGIYQDGVQEFLFSEVTSNVHELFIGPDPFNSGEEYRIQLGENSNASGRIFFIEGVGNDVIIDRAGAGADQGVQIRGSGLPIARFLSSSIKIFQPLNANAQDLFNVVDVKSNGGGGATTGTIGELITSNGGFDYFMRDTLAWESDANVKLTFGSGGITLETNGTDDDIDILAPGTNSDIDIRAATGGFLSLGRSGVNQLQFGSGVSTFSNANLFLTNGSEYISFLDAASGATLATPASGDINLFNDSDTGELSVKKFGGTVVSLEDVGGTGDVVGPGTSTDNAIARFDGTTGKIIQNSGILINDSNGMAGVDSILFAAIGGQISVADDAAGFNFVSTSDRPFRFTPNSTNVLDIQAGGLTMLGSNNIILGNNNITGVNQIAFNTANQTITDDTNGMRFSLPDALDTYDFTIDTNLTISIEKFFLNLSNTRIQMTQEVDPASPTAGDIFTYAKLDSGIAKLFYKQSDGTVVGPLGTGGAGGANTALSNLVTVAINTSLLPNADGTLNLGTASLSWLDTFTERLRIETGGASTSTANQIIADTGGMIFNTPAGDRYEFNISGSPNGIAIEEDRIQFLTTGRQHRIDVGSTSITIISESTNDSIFLFPGAARSNAAVNVQNLQTKFLNNTTASRYELLLVYTNAITTGQPAIGNIGFMADSSLNVESAYAGIVTAIESDVSTARNGRMQLLVANDDGAGAAGVGQLTGIGMDVQSDVGIMKLGFFGVTPVARQSPAANSAAIITALQNLGLFV